MLNGRGSPALRSLDVYAYSISTAPVSVGGFTCTPNQGFSFSWGVIAGTQAVMLGPESKARRHPLRGCVSHGNHSSIRRDLRPRLPCHAKRRANHWKLPLSSSNHSAPPAILPPQALTSTLLLPGNSFAYNTTVWLSLSVCYSGTNDPETCGNSDAFYTVVSSPLVAVVTGVNATVGADGAAVLDASGSSDDDNDPTRPTFRWTCVSAATGAPCAYANGTSVAVAANATTLTLRGLPPGPYAVSLRYSKGARAAVASGFLDFLDFPSGPKLAVIDPPLGSARCRGLILRRASLRCFLPQMCHLLSHK